MNNIVKLTDIELIDKLRENNLSCDGNRYSLICRLYDHLKTNNEESSSEEDEWDVLSAFNYPEIVLIVLPNGFFNKRIKMRPEVPFYFSRKKRRLVNRSYNVFYSYIKQKRRSKNKDYSGDIFALKFLNRGLWNEICDIASDQLGKTTTQAIRYKEVSVEDSKRMLLLYF